MRTYILKRLLLIPLTLWGIITINFAIIQLAPGGPVDYILAQYRGINTDSKASFTSGIEKAQSNNSQYRRRYIAKNRRFAIYRSSRRAGRPYKSLRKTIRL